MLKRLLRLLDIFLAEDFSDAVEVPLLYRGRVIVVTNLMSCQAIINSGQSMSVIFLSFLSTKTK